MKQQNKVLLFLMLTLFMSLFVPFVDVHAQPDQYFLRVELEKAYGIRGEVISITAYTNYTGYNLRIINPLNITIYNQNHLANTTQELPIVEDAEYGTYRIEARIPNRLVTTWFTVLDITGWSLATFPHIVEHNGLTYSFNRNWTITVSNSIDETININLQQLAQWVDNFDLDFTPLTNDMNFLVRFSKGTYLQLDLCFSFIHTGCKIIVNGTLDRARDFNFHVSGTKLRNIVDGIKQGHIVFDWSDLKKASHSFDYDRTTHLLTVHIPQTFSLDPTIFADGFESGDFSEWTGTMNTPELEETIVYSGDYAMKVDMDDTDEAVYIEFSPEPIIYVLVNIYLTAFETVGNDKDIIQFKDNLYNIHMSVFLYNDGGTQKLGYWCGSSHSIDNPLTINTYYSIIVKYDNTNDEQELWINDVSVISSTDERSSDIYSVYIGSLGGSGYTVDADGYFDAVTISDEFISSNIAPVNYACTITNMDDINNLYAQISEGYTLDYDGYDLDGYADISYVLVNITQDALVRACFKYTNSTDTFSLEAGDTEFTLDGSSSASRAGNVINLTIVFHVQWDAVEEDSIELKCVIADGDASDTDTMQTAYADVITSLVTSFSIDDDRGDISQSVTASGSVTYTGSSLYPPDTEFTSVSVYDSGNNNEGTDPTIVNGAWSVVFNAPVSVGTDTYNLYVDMADADYSDGELATTDTFITDRVEIVSVAFDDSRINVGGSAEVRYVLRYDYDDVAFDSGKGTVTDFTWDSGNSWWDKTITGSSLVTLTMYDEAYISFTDSTYGITAIEDDVGEGIITDRIIVVSLQTNNTSPLESEYVAINATLKLEYDNHILDDGINDVVNLLDAFPSTSMSWDDGSSTWKIEEARTPAIVVVFNEITAIENTYGITAINMDDKSVTVTWGTPVEYAEKGYVLSVWLLACFIFVPVMLVAILATRRRK